MSEYFSGVYIFVAVLCLLRLLLYREKGDFATRLAFCVLTLYTVVTPLSDVISDISGEISLDFELPDGEAGEYSEVAENAFCEGVKTFVCSEFSLSADSVRVLTEDFDFSAMRPGRVRVFLSGKAAAADYKAIERLIEERGLGKCDVEIEIG